MVLGLRPVLQSVVCICVCKHPHLHTTLCSAHLRCANTTEEKKTSIFEVEKRLRQKNYPAPIARHKERYGLNGLTRLSARPN